MRPRWLDTARRSNCHGGYGSAPHSSGSRLDEARAAEKPFRIQVERHNLAAFRLYERLGFARLGEGATHISMEWSGPQ